jgi:tetratricopeptide (TPR) repeat protein
VELIQEWSFEFSEAVQLLNLARFYSSPSGRPTLSSAIGRHALYYAQSQDEKDVENIKLALARRERALGPEHPSMASSLNNLAELYRTRDRHAEAEPLLERALAIWEMVLGPEHPRVAAGLDTLAGLYRAQGRCEQATLLESRARAIRTKRA